MLADYISTEIMQIAERIEFDEDLLADNMVDSLGMLRLVGFIEASFEIKIPPQDFIIENFQNLNLLNNFLQQLFLKNND